MKHSWMKYLLIISAASINVQAHAANDDGIKLTDKFVIEADRIYIPTSAIAKKDKEFNFNWLDPASMLGHKYEINEIEKTVNDLGRQPKLSEDDKTAYANALYKLGTYYTHMEQNQGLAIARMEKAANVFSDKVGSADNDNQLAFAYIKQYDDTQQPSDKTKAQYYNNKVLSEIYPATKNKEVAFAYAIKGLIQSDDTKYVDANKSFKKSIEMYDQLTHGKDNEFVVLKSAMAKHILEQGGQELNAITMLQQVDDYWHASPGYNKNIYAAMNLVILGEAYLTLGNAKGAQEKLTTATNTYINVDGGKSPLLILPYELLADSSYQLGEEKAVDDYLQKADAIAR